MTSQRQGASKEGGKTRPNAGYDIQSIHVFNVRRVKDSQF